MGLAEHTVTAEHTRSRRSSSSSIFDPSQELADPGASSFLAFAVLVNRSARDLHDASYVSEWSGPGKRIPVFDVGPLREFLDDGARRYFLVELLNSFTTLASGSYLVQTRAGVRRRRFSELDPVPWPRASRCCHPASYRRLGDVALFLSGVWPDHTATHPYSPSQREWLARSAELGAADALAGEGLGFIEAAGAAWYRRSVDEANGTVSTGPTFLRSLADRFTGPTHPQLSRRSVSLPSRSGAAPRPG